MGAAGDAHGTYADADGLVLSPIDLTKHPGCPRATTLDLAVARRELEPPSGAGGALALISALGLEHEAA